jgi:hypothetical protein
MILLDILYALIVSLALTAIFAAGIRGLRNMLILLAFFFLLFLCTWAGGIWIIPLLGRPILSFFLVGLLSALFLMMFTPSARSSNRRGRPTEEKIFELLSFDLFFGILIAGLIIAIVLRYIIIMNE